MVPGCVPLGGTIVTVLGAVICGLAGSVYKTSDVTYCGGRATITIPGCVPPGGLVETMLCAVTC